MVALTERKPVIIKVEPVAEDNKLARLRESKKNIEVHPSILSSNPILILPYCLLLYRKN